MFTIIEIESRNFKSMTSCGTLDEAIEIANQKMGAYVSQFSTNIADDYELTTKENMHGFVNMCGDMYDVYVTQQ